MCVFSLNPLPTWEAKIRLVHLLLHISPAHSLSKRSLRIQFIKLLLSTSYKPNKSVLASGEEEINRSGFLLSSRLAQWKRCVPERGSLIQFGWETVTEILPEETICLGWVPSKQSLKGEILDKLVFEGDYKKPVEKWGKHRTGEKLRKI